jgi:hypothetical protein
MNDVVITFDERKALTDRIAQLEAALRRHREVIVKCVTDGVLRHDLNVFLAIEADVLDTMTGWARTFASKRTRTQTKE